MPVKTDILTSLQSGIAVDWAVPLTFFRRYHLGHFAFDISISRNKSLTISGVHNIDSAECDALLVLFGCRG